MLSHHVNKFQCIIPGVVKLRLKFPSNAVPIRVIIITLNYFLPLIVVRKLNLKRSNCFSTASGKETNESHMPIT